MFCIWSQLNVTIWLWGQDILNSPFVLTFKIYISIITNQIDTTLYGQVHLEDLIVYQHKYEYYFDTGHTGLCYHHSFCKHPFNA